MRLIRLAALLALAACSSDRKPHASPVHGEPVTAAPPSGTATPAAGGDRCAAIRARFDAVHARGRGSCTSNADCACFNPVGGPHHGCGGVTDAATAKALAAIEREFHATACQYTHQCGASVCTPRCEAGRCS